MIKTKVQKLIKKYKTNDPFIISELLNVHIIYDNHLNKTLGYHFYALKQAYIVLNANIDTKLYKYILSHELGHTLLHRRMNLIQLKANTLFSIDKYEKQADVFASELLITDEFIFANQELSIYDIANILQIPHELVLLKYNNLKKVVQ